MIDADTGERPSTVTTSPSRDIIWTGPQPTLREMGAEAGVAATFPMAALEARLRKAIALRTPHPLPAPYRGETKLQLSALLGIKPALLHDYKSVELMFAVAEMREKKSAEEIEEMERAFEIGYRMHTLAMQMCRPGVVEREIAGAIEGVAKSYGSGPLVPLDRFAARRDAPQPALRRRARGRPPAAVRRRRRDGEQLLLGPHAHLSRQRTLHAEAEGYLQHRPRGPRPRGPHRQAPT